MFEFDITLNDKVKVEITQYLGAADFDIYLCQIDTDTKMLKLFKKTEDQKEMSDSDTLKYLRTIACNKIQQELNAFYTAFESGQGFILNDSIPHVLPPKVSKEYDIPMLATILNKIAADNEKRIPDDFRPKNLRINTNGNIKIKELNLTLNGMAVKATDIRFIGSGHFCNAYFCKINGNEKVLKVFNESSNRKDHRPSTTLRYLNNIKENYKTIQTLPELANFYVKFEFGEGFILTDYVPSALPKSNSKEYNKMLIPMLRTIVSMRTLGEKNGLADDFKPDNLRMDANGNLKCVDIWEDDASDEIGCHTQKDKLYHPFFGQGTIAEQGLNTESLTLFQTVFKDQ